MEGLYEPGITAVNRACWSLNRSPCDHAWFYDFFVADIKQIPLSLGECQSHSVNPFSQWAFFYWKVEVNAGKKVINWGHVTMGHCKSQKSDCQMSKMNHMTAGWTDFNTSKLGHEYLLGIHCNFKQSLNYCS